MLTYIGEIAEMIPTIYADSLGTDAHTIFEHNPNIEGIIVVTSQQHPVGLIMKSMFYKKLALRYGLDLFMGRSVELIMDKKPLIVDYFIPITEISKRAMDRGQDHLYDYVIVSKEQYFFGIVSIKTLLIKFAEVQVEVAKYTNPLSGLPGNNLIEEKMTNVLTESEYSVLYMDLDNFKAFNDTYGFNKGDALLRETASIISRNGKHSFVGHIGGDDFISIIPHYDYEEICERVLSDFNASIKDFYSREDFERGFVRTKNRSGIEEDIPLVTLSIAVITNKAGNFRTIDELSQSAADVKKICKQISGSCYSVNHSLEHCQ
ncbi:GGDEF domain-containing protein [Bacillus sp. DJP31]|uniref:GGDEF domain-containing protein n=1 Tax=Bacillus sp. DJP31 TaxID=3409789 RepID=UPI003BB74F96